MKEQEEVFCRLPVAQQEQEQEEQQQHQQQQ
jgi:hypothetical protein